MVFKKPIVREGGVPKKPRLPKVTTDSGLFVKGADWERKLKAIQNSESAWTLFEHEEEQVLEIHAQLTNYEEGLAWEIAHQAWQSVKDALEEVITNEKTIRVRFSNFETGIAALLATGTRESVMNALFTNPEKLEGRRAPCRIGYVYTGFISDGFMRVGGAIFRIRRDSIPAAEQPRVKLPRQIDLAAQFLTSLLADGPVDAAQAMELAHKAGLSSDSIFRARQGLGVQVVSHGRQGSTWQRPKLLSQEPENAQISKIKTLTEGE